MQGGAMSQAQLVVGAPIALAVSRWRFSRLRRVDPHPLGLSAVPPVLPMMLWSDGWGPGLTDISLSYGRPHAVSGQLIEVATCFSEPDCDLPSPQEAIARAGQRDAAWARGDWEDAAEMSGAEPFEVPVPPTGFDRQERRVVVAGQQHGIPVVSRGGYEALQFRHGRMVVTAVARRGFPDVPSFGVVDDLEPYLAGYTRFVAGWLRFWEA
jgi:hypothetical protein